VRAGYVERNGEWVPEIDDSGLRDNHRRALEEAKAAKDQLRALLGDRKPEDIAEILKAHATSEEERARKAGEFDKLLDKRVTETKTEYEKRIAALEPYKAKYEDKEVETAIREFFVAGGGIAEDLPLVIPIVKGSRIRYDEKTGKAVVYDKEGDATGLTPEKFFAETFKAEASKFYHAAGGSGGGSNGGTGAARQVTGGVKTVNIRDQSAFLANIDALAKGEVKGVVG
jgi:hypothetical protein